MSLTDEKTHFEVDWTEIVAVDCAYGALPSPPGQLHWRATGFGLYWKNCSESWTHGRCWEARYLEGHCLADWKEAGSDLLRRGTW